MKCSTYYFIKTLSPVKYVSEDSKEENFSVMSNLLLLSYFLHYNFYYIFSSTIPLFLFLSTKLKKKIEIFVENGLEKICRRIRLNPVKK